jgi:hypothetical protein
MMPNAAARDVGRILLAGQFIGHNVWRFNAFCTLGVECQYLDQRRFFDESRWTRPLDKLEFRAKRGIRISIWNRALLRTFREYRPAVVWIDKGLFLYPRTVQAMRDAGAFVVHCLHDDFRYPLYQRTPFERAVPLYNLHLVTRPSNVEELRRWGAAAVESFLFSFESTVHRPVQPGLGDDSFGADVVFVGHYEPGREHPVSWAAATEARVGVWGPMWIRAGRRALRRTGASPGTVRGPGLWGDDYARVFYGGRIALGLLSRWMRDEHTCRTMEIPACGGLLLAERTAEHLNLFEEGREALFFRGMDELQDSIRYLMTHPEKRTAIAAAGRRRCIRSGYDHVSEARRHLVRIRRLMS